MNKCYIKVRSYLSKKFPSNIISQKKSNYIDLHELQLLELFEDIKKEKQEHGTRSNEY